MSRVCLVVLFCHALLCMGMIPLHVAGATASFKPGSEPDGFREIKWGAELSALHGMRLKQTLDSGIGVYERSGDDLKWGRVILRNIHYGFRDNRLVDVYIVADTSQWAALKRMMTEKYGQGHVDKDRYYWMGEKTVVTLQQDKSLGKVRVLFTSVPPTKDASPLQRQIDARWIPFWITERDEEVYYDPSSLEIHQNSLARILVKSLYPERKTTSDQEIALYREHSALVEFDCARRTYRILQESWVMRNGQTRESANPGIPQPVSSHAVMERLAQTACGRAAR